MLFNLAFVVFALSQINAMAVKESQVNSYQNDYNRLLEIISQKSISDDDIGQAKEYIELLPTTVLNQKEQYLILFNGKVRVKEIMRF